jgi:hypothetical protein
MRHTGHAFDDLLGRFAREVHGDGQQASHRKQAEACLLNIFVLAPEPVREHRRPEEEAEQWSVVENEVQVSSTHGALAKAVQQSQE